MSDSTNKKISEKTEELKVAAAGKAEKSKDTAKKAAAKKAPKKKGKISAFFKEYRSELKKISWPTFKEVVKNTCITLIVCLMVGIVIWLADWGLDTIRTLIIGGKDEPVASSSANAAPVAQAIIDAGIIIE